MCAWLTSAAAAMSGVLAYGGQGLSALTICHWFADPAAGLAWGAGALRRVQLMILTSASMLDMLSSVCRLQAQLRGLIGDYSDPDEGALAAGLEAFDMLNNVLEEHSETAPQVCGLATTPYIDRRLDRHEGVSSSTVCCRGVHNDVAGPLDPTLTGSGHAECQGQPACVQWTGTARQH